MVQLAGQPSAVQLMLQAAHEVTCQYLGGAPIDAAVLADVQLRLLVPAGDNAMLPGERFRGDL